MQSTLEVLMQFIKCGDGSAADASGIFSKECYNSWVTSRKNVLLNPEQAFHRVFLSHLRGTDTRRPFPPDIEADILKILRSGDNPWERCFGENKLHVGKLGFRNLGYHEKKKLENENLTDCANSSPGRGSGHVANHTERDHNLIIKLPAKKKRKLANVGDKNGTAAVTPVSSVSNFNVRSNQSGTSDLYIPEAYGVKLLNERSFFSESKDLLINTNTSFEFGPHEARPPTPWEALWGGLHELNQVGFVNKLLDMGREVGMDFLPPAVVFLLQQPIPKDDEKFKLNFMCPPPAEQKFLLGRPIGKYLINPVDSCVLDADIQARTLLMRQLTGDLAFSHLASLYELWMGIVFLVKFMAGDSAAWRRLLFKRGDGKIRVLLYKSSKQLRHACTSSALDTLNGADPNDIVHVAEFQDVTDLYPEIIQRPYFI